MDFNSVTNLLCDFMIIYLSFFLNSRFRYGPCLDGSFATFYSKICISFWGKDNNVMVSVGSGLTLVHLQGIEGGGGMVVGVEVGDDDREGGAVRRGLSGPHRHALVKGAVGVKNISVIGAIEVSSYCEVHFVSILRTSTVDYLYDGVNGFRLHLGARRYVD